MSNVAEVVRFTLPADKRMRGSLCRWAVAGAVVTLAVCWGRAVVAQQPPPVAALSIDALETTGGNVTASVSALDGSGRPVAGLSSASFSLTLDGSPIRVDSSESAASSALPLSLVVVVDTSGSMAGAAITAAKAATTDLVAALQPADHVSVISFASTVAAPTAFAADKTLAIKAISALGASGNTALYAATRQAAETARLAPDRRRAVVFLTDGEDFGNASGGVTRDAALSSAAGAGVPFFVVGVGSEVDRAFLSSLGTDTGGQYLAATSSEDLKKLYGLISDRLRLQYTVRFALPPTLAGGVHRLHLSVAGAATETTLTTSTVATAPRIAGIANVLTSPVVVSVDGIGSVPVRFALDGIPLTDGPDSRSVRLDPYDIAPGSPHQLTADWASGPGSQSLSTAVNVAALAPAVLSPTDLPGLRPGDLVRVTVRAQPGVTVEMVANIDGRPIADSAIAPFEFTLPTDGVAAGRHELSISLTSSGGVARQSFPFVVAAPERGSVVAAYVLIVIAGLAGVATIVSAAWIGVRRLTRRPDPGFRPATHERMPPVRTDPSEATRTSAVPWATITVISGHRHGHQFVLTQERELLGSGRACSVRIRDSAVQEAHAVLDRNGAIHASSPTCLVRVDGEDVRSGMLRDGSELLVGATELRFDWHNSKAAVADVT